MPVIQGNAVSLQEILELRGHRLHDNEVWHIISQAAESLQDLFVNDAKALSVRPLFIICPDSLMLLPNGKVDFYPKEENHMKWSAYQPPEIYSPYRDDSELAIEKMYVYSLGMTLFFATEYQVDSLQISKDRQLQCLLLSMCEESPEARVNLLDVIELAIKNVPFRINSNLLRTLVKIVFGEISSDMATDEAMSTSESYYSCPSSYDSNTSYVKEHLPFRHENWQIRNVSGYMDAAVAESDAHLYSRFVSTDLGMHQELTKGSPSEFIIDNQGIVKETNDTHLRLTEKQDLQSECYFSEWDILPNSAPLNWYAALSKQGTDTVRETTLISDSESNVSGDEKLDHRNLQGKFIPIDVDSHLRRLQLPHSTSHNKRLSFHEGLQITSISDYSPVAVRKDHVVRQVDLTEEHVRTSTNPESINNTKSHEYKDLRKIINNDVFRVDNSSHDFVDASRDSSEKKNLSPIAAREESFATVARQQKQHKASSGPEFVQYSGTIVYPSPEKQLPTAGLYYRDGHRNVQVVLLNGQRLILDIPVNITGKELFEKTIRYLELDEFFYFGLGFIFDGEFQFLDLDAKLSKYLPKSWKEGSKISDSGFALFFRVKYYVENVSILRTRLSQHLYYLQLRKDILEGTLNCPEEPALLLASYALQAETGDYLPNENDGYFVPEQYLPAKIIQRMPHIEMRQQLVSMHSAHMGLGHAHAELEFLKEAQKLPHYGVHFHRLFKTKRDTTSSIWLGVCLRGLILFEERGEVKLALSRHPWHMITQVSFNKKQFTIEPQGNEANKLIFYTKHPKRSRYLLQLCTSFHAFQIQIRSKTKTLERFEAQKVYNERLVDNDDTINSIATKTPYDSATRNVPENSTEIKADVHLQGSEGRSDSQYSLPCQVNSVKQVTNWPKRKRTATSSFSSENEAPQSTSSRAVGKVASQKSNKQLQTRTGVQASGIETAQNYQNADLQALHTVKFQKAKDKAIGIVLTDVDGISGSGTCVRSVTANGLADTDGSLMPGDKIVSVNGINVERNTADSVNRLLRDANTYVELQYSRMNRQEKDEVDAGTTATPEKVDVYLESTTISAVAAIDLNDDVDGIGFSENGQGNLKQLNNESHNGHVQISHDKTKYESEVSFKSRTPANMSIASHLEHKNLPTSPQLTVPKNAINVKLIKKNDSLGLRIGGGVNTSVRDGGIYIKALDPLSSAADNGIIQVGDRILAVNGISLIGVTHKTARETIIKCPEEVNLVIDRSQNEYLSTQNTSSNKMGEISQLNLNSTAKKTTRELQKSPDIVNQDLNSPETYDNTRAKAYYVSTDSANASMSSTSVLVGEQNTELRSTLTEQSDANSASRRTENNQPSIRTTVADESDIFLGNASGQRIVKDESSKTFNNTKEYEQLDEMKANPAVSGIKDGGHSSAIQLLPDTKLQTSAAVSHEDAKLSNSNNFAMSNSTQVNETPKQTESVSQGKYMSITSANELAVASKAVNEELDVKKNEILHSTQDSKQLLSSHADVRHTSSPEEKIETANKLDNERSIFDSKQPIVPSRDGSVKLTLSQQPKEKTLKVNEMPIQHLSDKDETVAMTEVLNVSEHITNSDIKPIATEADRSISANYSFGREIKHTSDNDSIDTYVDKSQSESSHNVFKVSLKKGRQGLGFSIAEGLKGTIIINKIFPLQPAAASQELEEKDVLLAVNGISISGYKRSDAVALLRNQPTVVELLVQRSHNMIEGSDNSTTVYAKAIDGVSSINEESRARDQHVEMQIQKVEAKLAERDLPSVIITSNRKEDEVASSQGPGSEIIELTLMKGKTGLGFSITTANGGPQVKEIVGDPARSDGRLQKGDLLISVNGKDISRMTQKEVVQFLRTAERNVSITAVRYLNEVSTTFSNVTHAVSSAAAVNVVSAAVTKDRTGQKGKGIIDSQNRKEDSANLINGNASARSGVMTLKVDDLSLSTSNMTQNVTVPNSELNVITDNMQYHSKAVPGHSFESPQIQDSYISVTSVDDNTSDAADLDEIYNDPRVKIVEVELEKGTTGLGFNLMSGDGKTKFTNGIFIKTIAPFSVAAKDGRLKAGDKLLKVNNESLIDVTHSQAVNIVRKAPKGTVNLTLAKLQDVSDLELRTSSKILAESVSDTEMKPLENIKKAEQRPVVPSSPLPDKLKKMLADWSSKASSARKSSTGIRNANEAVATNEQMKSSNKDPTKNFNKKTDYTGKDLQNLLAALKEKIDSDAVLNEFKESKCIKPIDGCEIGKDPDNRSKNRFRNILPCDTNRVKLSVKEGESDYVNASLIECEIDKEKVNKYIAAQGPLEDTIESFWQMVWENSIVVIGMVTKIVENGRQKCSQYWPDSISSPLLIGDKYEVCLTKQSEIGCYVIREISVALQQSTSEVRKVCQLQYIHWPDHGLPNSALDLIEFIHELRRVASDGMIMIHCSAGVGRTGVVMTIDIIETLIKHNNEVNIYSIVSDLKEQRQGMVQTKEQYEFCYQAYLELLKAME